MRCWPPSTARPTRPARARAHRSRTPHRRQTPRARHRLGGARCARARAGQARARDSRRQTLPRSQPTRRRAQPAHARTGRPGRRRQNHNMPAESRHDEAQARSPNPTYRRQRRDIPKRETAHLFGAVPPGRSRGCHGSNRHGRSTRQSRAQDACSWSTRTAPDTTTTTPVRSPSNSRPITSCPARYSAPTAAREPVSRKGCRTRP